MKDTLYFRKEFSQNLKRIMDLRNKKQIDLINDLNLSKASVSSWVNGSRLPRMDKVDLLANYLGVKRSDLMGLDEEEPKDQYYLDPDVAEIAQELKDNSDMRVLFDASRDISKEDMELVVSFIERLKK